MGDADRHGPVVGELQGIAQQVEQHLLRLPRICPDGEPGLSAIQVHRDTPRIDLVRHQRTHPFQQRAHVDIRKLRRGQFGEAAISLHEIEQSAAACVDSRHAAQHVVLLLGLRNTKHRRRDAVVDQGLADQPAERDDRRDGIHDLVSQHADEFLPGVDLLPVELVADILERDQLVTHFEQLERGGIQHQLESVVAAANVDQCPVAVAEFLQEIRQPCVHALERAQTVHVRHPEQDARRLVHHGDVALGVQATQRNADMLDDRLQVLMVGGFLQVQAPELPRQQSIGILQLCEHSALVRNRHRRGEIVTGDVAEETGQLARGHLDIPDQFEHAEQDQCAEHDRRRQPVGIQHAPGQSQAQSRERHAAQHHVGAEAIQSHSGSFSGTGSCVPGRATAPPGSNCRDGGRSPAGSCASPVLPG